MFESLKAKRVDAHTANAKFKVLLMLLSLHHFVTRGLYGNIMEGHY